jgi:hypothetical protein
MTWISFAVLIWLAGAGMHHWPGPIRVGRGVMTWRMSRHRSRRSGAYDMPPRGDVSDVMTSGEGLDEEGIESVDPGGILTRSVPAAQMVRVDTRYGPDGSHQLTLGDTDDVPADRRPPDRRTWVAGQVTAGRRPGDIDTEGARLYGVSPRTIARDRMTLTRQRGSK